MRWPSGKASVCKTDIRGFDSRPHLFYENKPPQGGFYFIPKSSQKSYNTSMAKRNIVQVEIKHIPLDIEDEGLGVVELTDLAGKVENYMQSLDEIDTLKQALITALHFAAQAYVKDQNEGGKRQEEESRVSDLILKLRGALETPNK